MGDFNLEPHDKRLGYFLNSNNLVNLVKTNTFFTGRGSCIDLILKNRKYSFKNTTSYETGLSDHHHMILTILKTNFQQKEPKCLIYRDYKNFIFENFKNNLQEALQSCKGSFDTFDNNFTSCLNKHAPKKKKVLRENEKPHMNNNLRRATMKSSKLKNKANKTKNPLDIMNYKKQRNYVTKLNKTAKLEYFNNLKLRKDSKPFWEKCKPYFTNKRSKADTDIMLNENGELLLKDKDIADTFNEYFGSIVELLDLYKWESEITNLDLNDSNQDCFDITINKYEKHPSIQMIKQNFRISKKFSLEPVSNDEVKKIIKDLKNSKSVGGKIPTKILKESDFTFEILSQCINKSFASGEFPDCLKQANVSPIFKKDDPLDKENYRPISILPLISKVYETILYNRCLIM